MIKTNHAHFKCLMKVHYMRTAPDPSQSFPQLCSTMLVEPSVAQHSRAQSYMLHSSVSKPTTARHDFQLEFRVAAACLWG